MAQKSNDAVIRLAGLYHDIRKIEKTLDRISQHTECPPGIKYEVLKPIKSKLLWFRNAMEAKLADRIDLKAYGKSQREDVLNEKIMRMVSYMTPDQRQLTSNIISGMLEGKVLNLTVTEGPEEDVF